MPRRQAERATVGADATRRAARTLFQVGTVTALIQLYNVMVGDQRQLNADQVAAVTTVGTILVSLIQNLLEEQGAVPEMLKGPPAAPPTTLTPEQMLATAEYLTQKARDAEPEPPIFTEQETSPARTGVVPRPFRG